MTEIIMEKEGILVPIFNWPSQIQICFNQNLELGWYDKIYDKNWDGVINAAEYVWKSYQSRGYDKIFGVGNRILPRETIPIIKAIWAKKDFRFMADESVWFSYLPEHHKLLYMNNHDENVIYI